MVFQPSGSSNDEVGLALELIDLPAHRSAPDEGNATKAKGLPNDEKCLFDLQRQLASWSEHKRASRLSV